MQFKRVLLAAAAAGAMNVAANAAENASENKDAASRTASVETGNGFLKQFFQARAEPHDAGEDLTHLDKVVAGSATRKVARTKPHVAGEDLPGVDKTVTASISRKAAKTTSVKKAAKTASDRPYHSIISRYAAAYGVPESLAHAVITVESNYKASAHGSAGEVGLMQIKPATARGMGFRGSVKALYDPETNIKYGMRYLGEAYKLGGGDTCGAILRYNAGHGAKHMNPISSRYCAKVRRILGEG